MTKEEFYHELRKLDKSNWISTGDGQGGRVIRLFHKGREYCPITAVIREKTGRTTSMVNADADGADLLGLTLDTAEDIIEDADDGGEGRSTLFNAIRHLQ